MSLATMMPRKAHIALAFIVALAFFVFLAIGIQGTDAWSQDGVGGAEDFETLADGLFDDHVIALEVLGILLTAAMIGAMVIARPLGTVPDATNYPTKRRGDDLEDIQGVSDVSSNLGTPTFRTVPVPTPEQAATTDAAPSDDGGEEE